MPWCLATRRLLLQPADHSSKPVTLCGPDQLAKNKASPLAEALGGFFPSSDCLVSDGQNGCTVNRLPGSVVLLVVSMADVIAVFQLVAAIASASLALVGLLEKVKSCVRKVRRKK